MNTFVATFSRDITCAAAATLITILFSVAFVQSTSVPPGMHATGTGFVALSPEHAWFGQPEPAVLVD
jgi:hypothetical protein